MADLLESGMAWLESQRAKFMTRLVIYNRGNDSVQVPATIGQTVFELDEGTGAVLKVESRDFLITAAELILSGSPVLPERGDRITETQGSKTFIYEVMAPGDEPHWRYSDPYRKTLRIHSKQVDVGT